jgi:hypothetical protein
MNYILKKSVRITAGLMLLLAALNAFAGGIYAIIGAPGIPAELLEGSPFSEYLIPGIILFVLVGGSFLAASLAMLKNSPKAISLSYFSLLIVAGWLAVQISIIGYVTVMQPATAIYSAIMLALILAGRNSS